MADEKQSSKWDSFVSLKWYDGFIEFIFRFVAKTSEPLLAAGLVISAADFLTKGALMRNNEVFSLAWAWTQGIAIEASSGVVFVYGLEGFKQGDKVKAWLYIGLSILLAVTGGAMLFLQFMNNTTGLSDSTLPGAVTDALGVLRVLVSVGYVFMCRAKHIEFTTLFKVQDVPPVQVQAPDMEQAIEQRIAPLIEQLDERYSRRLEVTVKQVVEQFTLTIEQVTAPRLPAIQGTDVPQIAPPKVQDGSVGAKVQLYLEQQRGTGREPTLQEIMDSTGCSKGTAIRYRKQ